MKRTLLLAALLVVVAACSTEQRAAIHDRVHDQQCGHEVGRTDRDACAGR